jgi:hypothetical protein
MPDDSVRLAALRTDIAQRLRKVCEAMPQNEFDQLVDRIAQLEYKYEQIRELLPPRPPASGWAVIAIEASTIASLAPYK